MARTDEQALLLQVSADISRLEKAFDRATGVVKTRSKQMEAQAGFLEKVFSRPSLTGALDKVFDETRFRALDSGAAKLGVFGGALEALGPAGLAAGAGIGAFTAAMAGALAAAQFADELADTAARLHVTTDALQEYRFALRLAGGEEKGADESLEKFSVTLGKAQEGLTKAQRAFLLLGFTKEQIAAFRTSEEALRAVTAKLAEIESNPRRDALISLLGLDSMKPLIQGGVEAMDELRAKAREVGVVMDEELIQKGAQVTDEFETLSQVIDVQVKSSLVGLGPVLIRLMEFAAALSRSFGRVSENMNGPVGAILKGAPGRAAMDMIGARLGLPSGVGGALLGQTLGALRAPSAPAAARPGNVGIPTSGEGLMESLNAAAGRSSGRAGRGRAAGRAAQPIRAVEVFDPEVMQILQELEYWQGVEKRANELRPALDVSGDFVATLDEQLAQARDATQSALYDGVRSGLEAGFYGGVPGVIEYLKAQLMRALLDGVSRTLSTALADATAGTSSSWVKTALAFVTGGFATGTNYAPGGMAMVGERGPELVNLPRGSTVTPHGLADIRPRASAGPVVIHADFTGAVVTEELMASFRSYADQVGARAAAEGAARGSAQAQTQIYSRARNRLGR